MNKDDATQLLIVVCCLLLVPVLGNIFSDSWHWGIFDYLILGMLLFSLGTIILFARRKITVLSIRLVVMVGAIMLSLMIWSELAVEAVSKFIGFD